MAAAVFAGLAPAVMGQQPGGEVVELRARMDALERDNHGAGADGREAKLRGECCDRGNRDSTDRDESRTEDGSQVGEQPQTTRQAVDLRAVTPCTAA